MNLSRLEAPLVGALPNNQLEAAARQTAVQFEALFLNQLTAALNTKSDDEEDNVFSSTGADMYKQMFSEQMAKIMSENGGIGIADTILRQLREKAATQSAAMERAVAAVQAVKQGTTATPTATMPSEVLQAEVSQSQEAAPQLPLEGRITSAFGLRRDPLNGQQRQHHGVDIAAPVGTPIGATGAGKVVFAGRRGGYGNTIIIEQADGKQTLYGHADQLLAKVGDQITAGQVIATVGSTGRSTGPHLHFEVRENGQPINPLTNFAKDFALPDR